MPGTNTAADHAYPGHVTIYHENTEAFPVFFMSRFTGLRYS